ncbi:MAG: transcription elongation factor GreA [Candidatus Omnitrophica bacterium]|nr:transcription elongation factor GreA [Candidatus Omnitrophota bacterium]
MAATYLTKAGLAKLEEELKELKSQKHKLSKDVGTAREWGDLRENAEYHAAKERLQQVLSRISDLEFKLSNVNVVDPTQHEKGVATLGTQVTVKDLTRDREEKYILVGPDETDPAAGKISIQSPLGKAFLGRKIKEKVTVLLPAGPRPYLIISVELSE